MLIVGVIGRDGRRWWRGADMAISGARRMVRAKPACVHRRDIAIFLAKSSRPTVYEFGNSRASALSENVAD
jgi:hypothetical protein